MGPVVGVAASAGRVESGESGVVACQREGLMDARQASRQAGRQAGKQTGRKEGKQAGKQLVLARKYCAMSSGSDSDSGESTTLERDNLRGSLGSGVRVGFVSPVVWVAASAGG